MSKNPKKNNKKKKTMLGMFEAVRNVWFKAFYRYAEKVKDAGMWKGG